MRKTINLYWENNMLIDKWHYYNPVKIVFGRGSFNKLSEIVGRKKIILVTTPGFTKRGVTKQVCRLFGKGSVFVIDSVQPNPSFDQIEFFASELNKLSVDCIVALGGGSVIDTAKALSVVLSCRSKDISLKRLLKDRIGSIDRKSMLPVIAIPTTAGTGSEVTPFATIWDKDEKKKYSLATSQIYVYTCILDPELTLSLPKEETIASGLDALAHSLESIWNRNATPITNIYALNAIQIIISSLSDVVKDMQNITNRAQMMKAGLFAGLAISQTKTALSHSISYPLTAHFGIPHGLACAFSLPAIIKFNGQKDNENFSKIVYSLGFSSIIDFHDRLICLYKDIDISKLLDKYLLCCEDLLKLSSQMLTPERVGNNIRKVGLSDIQEILIDSWKVIFNG